MDHVEACEWMLKHWVAILSFVVIFAGATVAFALVALPAFEAMHADAFELDELHTRNINWYTDNTGETAVQGRITTGNFMTLQSRFDTSTMEYDWNSRADNGVPYLREKGFIEQTLKDAKIKLGENTRNIITSAMGVTVGSSCLGAWFVTGKTSLICTNMLYMTVGLVLLVILFIFNTVPEAWPVVHYGSCIIAAAAVAGCLVSFGLSFTDIANDKDTKPKVVYKNKNYGTVTVNKPRSYGGSTTPRKEGRTNKTASKRTKPVKKSPKKLKKNVAPRKQNNGSHNDKDQPAKGTLEKGQRNSLRGHNGATAPVEKRSLERLNSAEFRIRSKIAKYHTGNTKKMKPEFSLALPHVSEGPETDLPDGCTTDSPGGMDDLLTVSEDSDAELPKDSTNDSQGGMDDLLDDNDDWDIMSEASKRLLTERDPLFKLIV